MSRRRPSLRFPVACCSVLMVLPCLTKKTCSLCPPSKNRGLERCESTEELKGTGSNHEYAGRIA